MAKQVKSIGITPLLYLLLVPLLSSAGKAEHNVFRSVLHCFQLQILNNRGSGTSWKKAFGIGSARGIIVLTLIL
jgi:hypothetical protein